MPPKRGLYPSALATLTRQLEPVVEAGAKSFAESLRDNVGETSGGQGVHYSSLPNRSSAPNQYPIKQEGDLQASVEANPTNSPLTWRAGFYGEDIQKLRALEFGSANMAERAPLARTAADNETRQRMLEAARKKRR